MQVAPSPRRAKWADGVARTRVAGLHAKVVAWAFLLWGLVVLALGVGALLLYVGIGVGALGEGEVGALVATWGVGIAIGGALIALATPCIAAGAGLLLRRRWARPMGIGLAILHLGLTPLGTLFGCYALFALVLDP